MTHEPIVGFGAKTSPAVAKWTGYTGLTLLTIAYWFSWPTWLLVAAACATAYGSGVQDGYRWAREQRWMEWMADNGWPDWKDYIDSKWLECKQTETVFRR